MPYCLSCHGAGHLDFRDDDANMAERFTDAELDHLAAQGYGVRLGIVPCETCDSTGVISEDLWKDMMAHARAAVDQIIAGVAERERRGKPARP